MATCFNPCCVGISSTGYPQGVPSKLSPSYCYKKYKCRCPKCVSWKKESAKTNDKEKAKKRSKDWRLKNPERSRNSVKEWQKAHPEFALNQKLKKYGLKIDEYYKLVYIQDGKCAICKKKIEAIDHNHTTGNVRGLLCNKCNLGLGHFNDNIKLVQKALDYLYKFDGEF